MNKKLKIFLFNSKLNKNKIKVELKLNGSKSIVLFIQRTKTK